MDIQLYQSGDPVSACEKMGNWLAKSGLFGCEKVEQGAVLAMICMSERKSPTQLLRTYDIVDGKLRKKAMAAFADFRKAGGKVRWVKNGDDGMAAVADFQWEGESSRWQYTIDDAKRANLVKPNSGWMKNPGNMLRARVISNALGSIAPEIFAGEEAEEAQADEPTPAPRINLTVTPGVDPVAAAKPVQATVVTPEIQTERRTEETDSIPSETNPIEQPPVATPSEVPAGKQFAQGPAMPAGRQTLPVETVQALVAVLGEDVDSAMVWMLKNGWLKDGQTFLDLPMAKVKRIHAQLDSFKRAIEGAK
jgi:hypothetical protein